MTTRRTFLGTSAALAAVSAPMAEALAQAVQATGQVMQSGLVGSLQGVTQSTTIPTKFKEAPQLAELVKAGKLPPVEQRLPAEPMVLKPLDVDRPLRRHLAARLHRPLRRRERQPHQRIG